MSENNQLIRDHSTIDFEPGATKEIDLPRSHFYERLNLLADWDVTVNTAGTGQNGYGILDLIDRVEIQFNGSSTLKSTDFATSHVLDWYDYGTRPVYDSLDLSSATQQTGQVQTFLDFLLAPGNYGAMLPSFAFSDLTMSVKWGTSSSIADDVTVNDASIAVQSKERKKGTVANPPKVTTDEIVDNLLGFKERQRTVPIDYDGEHTVSLPRGNTYYGVAVAVLDGDTPDNDLIENVEIVENGVETHKATTFDLARAKDKQEYGIESRPDGFVSLDYGIRGDTDDVVDTAGMDDYELLLDTDGTQPTDPAEVRVVTREIVD